MIKNELEKILSFKVEATDNPDFGDYTSNVALGHKPPREYAEELIEKLKTDKKLSEIIEKINIAGPGFINFWLKTDVLVSNLMQIEEEKEKYGKSDLGKGKTVIVDYSAPNIAKPFGIGHLRSTIIGQALYNFYKFLGYNVIGDNHLGDWGTQFGKLLYMITSTKTTDFSIENLEKLYVQFHVMAKEDESLDEKARLWFKKLEDNDLEARTIWKQCINVSLNEFNRIYDLLNVKIDHAYGESFYLEEMKEMLSDSKITKYLEIGENNSRIINIPNFSIPLMFLKSDGATTYATRDMATLQFRQKKFKPDVIIYEVGVEQKLYFEQLFAAAKMLKIVSKDVELVHTAHGLYLAPDGKKFSTRKGKTIKLDEVLTEAIDRAKKLGSEDEKTAKIVGIGAIKYFDLMHSVQSNVVFDWEKIMNMEGNSGPYLQYTAARCNSVLAKKSASKREALQARNGMNSEESKILRTLIKFGEVVQASAVNYSPNLLCNYLYDLASKYNAFYNKNRVIGSENEDFRLKLTLVTGQILKNGLKLLGIEAPERM